MAELTKAGAPPFCPSAEFGWDGSVAIGVVGGTAEKPRVSLLATPQPVTEELLALASPVTPTEVLRFAAPCLCDGCIHFKDANCRLAERIVKFLPKVTDRLPVCAIRARCRWWLQEGAAACTRCPQVVTDNHYPSAEMRRTAYG
jgi:hypothetical protein